MIIIFRFSVVFFDMNYKGGNLNGVRNYKKLLNLLSRVELTQGFSDFINNLRLHKSAKIQYTLTPSKAVLMQLYLNEQIFYSQTELEFVRDVYLG